MCHNQIVIPWISHTTSGPVTPNQTRFTNAILKNAPTFSRHENGSAHKKGTSGCDITSRGAATSISTSCCPMCAENSTLPSLCSGETSANTNDAHPPAKQSIGQTG